MPLFERPLPRHEGIDAKVPRMNGDASALRMHTCAAGEKRRAKKRPLVAVDVPLQDHDGLSIEATVFGFVRRLSRMFAL